MPKVISNYIELHVSFNNKFLLLKRSPQSSIYPGIWQPITGGVEENELLKNTIERELKEETSLTANRVFIIPRVNTFYLQYREAVCLVPVFLVFANSDDVTISNEHTEFRWVSYQEALELIHWDNQQESLRIIQKYISDEHLFSKLVQMNMQ